MIKNFEEKVFVVYLLSSTFYLTQKLFDMMGVSYITTIQKMTYLLTFMILYLLYVLYGNKTTFYKLSLYFQFVLLVLYLFKVFFYGEERFLSRSMYIKLAMNVASINIISYVITNSIKWKKYVLIFAFFVSLSTLVSFISYSELINTRETMIYGFEFKGGFWNSSVIAAIITFWHLVYLLKEEKLIFNKFIITLLLCMILLGAFTSLSRSFFLSFLVSLLVFISFNIKNIKNSIKILIIIIVFSLVLYNIFPTPITLMYKRLSNTIFTQSIKSESRYLIWKNYLNNLDKYIIFGIGEINQFKSINNGQGPHSFIINWSTHFGIFTSVYLLVYILALLKRNLSKENNTYNTLAIIMFISFTFINETGFYENSFYIMLGFIESFTSIERGKVL